MNLSWLNPSSIYFKLIASALVFAMVGGAYFYVHNLQNQVVSLKVDNGNLKDTNQQLQDEVKAEAKLSTDINKVSDAGDKQRQQNKETYHNQLQNIDEKSKAGKDRAVGPLLREFFNE